jgi:uncharacterized protein YndB with AHSA1/START domain
MATIYHYFPINGSIEKVFEVISTEQGLDIWWSKNSEGKPSVGEIFQLSFGPEYQWSAIVSKYIMNQEFELTFTSADSDWINTKVGFELVFKNEATIVRFYHNGWNEENEHYKISNYCWAMYLRLLKRYIEFDEIVSYESRLDV